MKTPGLFLWLLLVAINLASAQPKSMLVAAEFESYQPVGLAISHQGRQFVSSPRWSTLYQNGVLELLPNGRHQPYPNAEWNRFDSLALQTHFVSVQALFIDADDFLWILDPANPGNGKSKPQGVKLLKVDLKTNQVVQTFRFADLPLDKASLNDVQVDPRRQLAYLSDPGRAALVVLNLKTGRSRTLLEKHASTTADSNFVLTIDGKEVRDQTGKPFASNVNGIALTPDFGYFYYRAITQTKLFRIRTDYLTDTTLSTGQVAAHVETVGEAGVSHGMIADRAGNVYMGDSQAKVIHRMTPAGKLETVVQDDRLLWPDSFAVGTDGFLYVTAAQFHRLPQFNKGQNQVTTPFLLLKVKL